MVLVAASCVGFMGSIGLRAYGFKAVWVWGGCDCREFRVLIRRIQNQTDKKDNEMDIEFTDDCFVWYIT